MKEDYEGRRERNTGWSSSSPLWLWWSEETWNGVSKHHTSSDNLITNLEEDLQEMKSRPSFRRRSKCVLWDLEREREIIMSIRSSSGGEWKDWVWSSMNSIENCKRSSWWWWLFSVYSFIHYSLLFWFSYYSILFGIFGSFSFLSIMFSLTEWWWFFSYFIFYLFFHDFLPPFIITSDHLVVFDFIQFSDQLVILSSRNFSVIRA